MLPKVDTAVSRKKRAITLAGQVQKVYLRNAYKPLWVDKNYKPTEAAATFIKELEDVAWDGLNPERYNLSAIKQLKEQLLATKKNVKAAITFDTLVTHSYFAASRELLLGTIEPSTVDPKWHQPNDTAWNGPQVLLSSNGRYPSLNNFRSEIPVYAVLRAEYKKLSSLSHDSTFSNLLASIPTLKPGDRAFDSVISIVIPAIVPDVVMDSAKKRAQLINAFQQYASLPPTGKADQETITALSTAPTYFGNSLLATMERIRWMRRQPGEHYIVVNIPQMELFFKDGKTNAMHMRVIVGRDERQTPALASALTHIIVNPWWEVPPTILRKDVIPGLNNSGAAYLAEKNLNVYTKGGRQLDASYANGSNAWNLRFRQPPGDDNALGRIKFHMPNDWDIYLHDTPHKEIFEKNDRLASSGCIRVQQPKEMALYILSQLDGKDYDESRLDNIIATDKNTWITLKRNIPVYVTYLTAFEDGTGRLKYNRDVYERDNNLIALLAH
jgi:murein L,D-transpeptidase YcbB/YkuD